MLIRYSNPAITEVQECLRKAVSHITQTFDTLFKYKIIND